MGKPLMIQKADAEKIELLKEKLGAKTKIEVVRAGLNLLEQQTERQARVERWKRATQAAMAESAEVNREFQKHSRIKSS
jgi:hypothetical protein